MYFIIKIIISFSGQRGTRPNVLQEQQHHTIEQMGSSLYRLSNSPSRNESLENHRMISESYLFLVHMWLLLNQVLTVVMESFLMRDRNMKLMISSDFCSTSILYLVLFPTRIFPSDEYKIASLS